MAAVVTMSRNCADMVQSAGRRRDKAPPRPSLSLFQLRALIAGIDILEALEHLDAAIRLHLAQIHSERRMALLRHLDEAARPLERDFGERLDDGVGLRRLRLLDRRLVEID